MPEEMVAQMEMTTSNLVGTTSVRRGLLAISYVTLRREIDWNILKLENLYKKKYRNSITHRPNC